mmetsp:Transcript_35348/g.88384  ORF Transcript_35348/g.88384 Transcript_35348/m.88384 type:complete len:99 (+) Transcript_35348:2677-2973(+)
MEVGVMVAVGAVVAMAVVMEVVGVDLEAVVGMGAGMVVVDLEMEVDWEVADWEAAGLAAVDSGAVDWAVGLGAVVVDLAEAQGSNTQSHRRSGSRSRA